MHSGGVLQTRLGMEEKIDPFSFGNRFLCGELDRIDAVGCLVLPELSSISSRKTTRGLQDLAAFRR
jgi:hypothetical protein